jgi:2-polyprenyl-3-methyl-5-hydroxy-6-metoxy-1,4-benzoquinol methylase
MPMPVREATRIMNLYHVNSILEAGCGKGGIIAQFNAPLRIGVDFYRSALMEARRDYPGILFAQQDVNTLPIFWLPGSFEAVIGFDILEHLAASEMSALIQNCEDLAKKLVIFFSPLDEAGLAMHPERVDDLPGMRHVTIIREEVFLKRGYKTFKYPNYYYGSQYENNITAMLAIKEL